jgi:3-hydroxyisobutyrate dehydrogenase-like beta-hydroxyacid dehydrogenase
MLEFADEMKCRLPMAAAALDCYDVAAKNGWGSRDETAMAVYRISQSKRPRVDSASAL